MKNEFPLLDTAITSGVLPANITEKLVCFEAQNVADIYFSDARDIFDFDADFGPLLPPFPGMWVEFDNRAYAHPQWLPLRLAAIVESFAPEEFEQQMRGGMFHPEKDDRPGVVHKILKIDVFANINRDMYGVVPATFLMGIDADGQRLWHRYGYAGNDYVGDKHVQGLVDQGTDVALLAIGLINCKNVSTETKLTRPRGGKKTKRHKPSIEYHIIKLPEPRRKSASTGEGAPPRFHKVRGHFKTYTAEKPLMGRIVGTYWWSYHARGSAENGEIISSYKVGADA